VEPARVPITRQVIAFGAAGAALAALLIGVLGYGAGQLGPRSVGAFTTSYDRRVLDDPLELLIVQSDGQAFASLARDPLLERPEVFRTDAEAAYRAQRPLFGYLAWALSLGRTGWVPPAMAFLSAAGAGFAVAGVAQLLADRRAPRKLALVVLLLPGTYTALSYCGPEPLGLGLVAWGLVAWSRRAVIPAFALFALAGLCRETLLFVPAALVLTALRGRRVRDASLVAATAVPYAVWFVFLRWRIGAWPTDANQGRLAAPFVGVAEGLASANSGSVPYAALCVMVGVGALVVGRRDPLAIVVASHLVLGAIMGDEVWISWEFFGRLLLPLLAFGLVTIAGKVFGRSAVPAAHGALQTRWLNSAPQHDSAGIAGPRSLVGGESKR
jgi:hypothetical protein